MAKITINIQSKDTANGLSATVNIRTETKKSPDATFEDLAALKLRDSLGAHITQAIEELAAKMKDKTPSNDTETPNTMH